MTLQESRSFKNIRLLFLKVGFTKKKRKKKPYIDLKYTETKCELGKLKF